MSIYSLKPKFQNILRPVVQCLARLGVTANQVTLWACGVSVLLGAVLCWRGVAHPLLFLALPIWMFLRMALNAIDGMLAREFNQKSALGAYLNELTDVISDAALYVPFALVAPFTNWQIGALVFVAVLSEYAGVLGLMVGASRRYDGPLGKSDRAFIFGTLGFVVGLGFTLPVWSGWGIWLLVLLTCLTILNRVRAGLAEAKQLSL